MHLFVKRHLWKMYSKNTCNTQCIKPTYKQRRNDFTNKTVYRFSKQKFRYKPKTKAESRIVKGKRNKLNLSIVYPRKLGITYNIV